MNRLLIRVALYLALFYALTGAVLSEFTLRLQRNRVDDAARQSAQAMARDANAALQTVEIVVSDGVVLRGWFFRNHQPDGKTVILLHGQADNRAGMLNYAKIFLRHRYDVLAPDSRAHGDSDGNIATYGVREVEDVHRWLDWLGWHGATGCVYGLGESMGAAILLQSLAGEPRFCAVVAESSFSTLREIAYDRVAEPLHAGPWLGWTLLRPLIESAFMYGRIRYGSNLAAVSPLQAIGASKVPVLLIHGASDPIISPRHSVMLSRSRTPHIDLWMPARAGHTEALSHEPEEFERRVIAFFATVSY